MTDAKLDALKPNIMNAYQGALGRKREAFCAGFVKKKQKVFKEFQNIQLQKASEYCHEVTCRKGCSHCCYLYVQASIPECEAIVYYLHKHHDALEAFLKNYAVWREKLREHRDIFKKCGDLWQEVGKPFAASATTQAFIQEIGLYKEQNIPCPFLINNQCSIYDVRPFSCAGMFSITPPELCASLESNNAKVFQTRTPLVYDNSFYYGEIKGDVFAFMPLVVHGILLDGYTMLSAIPGLEGLGERARKSLGLKRKKK